MNISTSNPIRLTAIALVLGTTIAAPASAEEDAAALAKKLSNPVVALISVPLQFNYDENIGSADDGTRWVLNVQPVVPIDLNEKWNLSQLVSVGGGLRYWADSPDSGPQGLVPRFVLTMSFPK